MKALVRNEGETITEDTEIAGIDWETGLPLTSAGWFGGSYILVNNYVPPVYETVAEMVETEDDSEDTVVINGVTYTKAELRALLGDE